MGLVSKTILLVEDEAIIALMEKQWLTNEGFNVIHVLSGEEAVKKICKDSEVIDLILMDIDLGPGIDGTQAAKEILKTHDIPLLFISSHSEPEIVKRTEEISSYGYVVKGSCETVLIASIKMAFKLHSANKTITVHENSLQKSAVMYSSIFEQSPIAIVCYDADGNLISENKACREMFGIDEKRERKPFNLFDDPNLDENIKSLLRRGDKVKFELKYDFELINSKNIYLSFQSGVRFFDVMISPLDIGYVAQLQDITGNKQTEQALLQREREFYSLAQNVPDLIIRYDRHMRHVFVNDAVSKTIGIPVEEIIGKTYRELGFPEQRSIEWEGYLKEVFESGKNKIIESIFNSSNGSSYILESWIVPEFDHSDNAETLLCITRDITAHKHTEQALEYSKGFLDLIIEMSPLAIWISDEKGTLIKSNQSLRDLLYITNEEVVGKYNIFNDNLVEEQGYMPLVNQVFKDGKPVRFTLLYNTSKLKNLRLKDSKSLYLDVSISAITNPDGKVINAIIQHSDVTESKKAELQLKEYAAELRKLNATKDRLFNIIAHDLRGPFTGFVGLTDELAKNLNNLNHEEISQYASVMNVTSKRILELLTNLLEWSKLQSGKVELIQTESDLYAIAENVCTLFSSAARNKSITIKNEIRPDTTIYADQNLLSASIRNLVSNAIKFTNPGGIICITSKTENEFIEICVSDNGIGMSTEIMDKLFKIDSGFTTRGTYNEQGSGFGLILCKEMIERSGGKINVYSIPGEGTTFTITLPAK